MKAINTFSPLARAEATKTVSQTRQAKTSNTAAESQLPASIASQRCILGAIIEDDDLVMPAVVASGLSSPDFLLSGHRRVFDAMLKVWEEKKHIDLILVTERLGNRQEDAVLAASLIQGAVVHPDHVLDHVEIVRNKARLRRVLHIAEWMTSAAADTDNVDALIEDAIQKLERISRPEVRA